MSTVDATLMGTNANSYVTMAEAATYFATRFFTDDNFAWNSATQAEKTGSILSACQGLESLHYKGSVSSKSQALAFPRQGILKRNSYAFEQNDVIPQRVKDAQCEWAAAILAQTFQLNPAPDEAGGSTKVGPIETPPTSMYVFRRIPPQVLGLLDRLLDESYLPNEIKLYR